MEMKEKTSKKIQPNKKKQLKTEKKNTKKGKKINTTKLVGIIFVVLVIILGIVLFTENKTDDNIVPTINTTNETKTDLVVEETPEEPIVEVFTPTKLELEVIELINMKRISYRKVPYVINMILSEINKEFLIVSIEESVDSAKVKVGDLGERKVMANITGNLRENFYEFEINDDKLAKEIVNQMTSNDLYKEEFTKIALTIIEENTTQYVMLNIY